MHRQSTDAFLSFGYEQLASIVPELQPGYATTTRSLNIIHLYRTVENIYICVSRHISEIYRKSKPTYIKLANAIEKNQLFYTQIFLPEVSSSLRHVLESICFIAFEHGVGCEILANQNTGKTRKNFDSFDLNNDCLIDAIGALFLANLLSLKSSKIQTKH